MIDKTRPLLPEHFKAMAAVWNGEKLPRKAKKLFLGKRMSKKKLRELLASVEIGKPAETMYDEAEIKPHSFCPNCGCTGMRGTGNMTSHPEHWENFYCVKCNFLVAVIDNSPFTHALEVKEYNYDLN